MPWTTGNLYNSLECTGILETFDYTNTFNDFEHIGNIYYFWMCW